MKRVALAACVCLFLASCGDGGFKYEGTVSSSSGAGLKDCSVALNYDGKVEDRHAFYPPKLEGLFMVAPFKGTYMLVISCAGHRQHEAVVKYGGDVTPTKDLHLGNIVLDQLH